MVCSTFHLPGTSGLVLRHNQSKRNQYLRAALVKNPGLQVVDLKHNQSEGDPGDTQLSTMQQGYFIPMMHCLYVMSVGAIPFAHPYAPEYFRPCT
jgi:hypothetical protein